MMSNIDKLGEIEEDVEKLTDDEEHKISLEIMEDDMIWNCSCGRGYSHLQIAVNHIINKSIEDIEERLKEEER